MHFTRYFLLNLFASELYKELPRHCSYKQQWTKVQMVANSWPFKVDDNYSTV